MCEHVYRHTRHSYHLKDQTSVPHFFELLLLSFFALTTGNVAFAITAAPKRFLPITNDHTAKLRAQALALILLQLHLYTTDLFLFLEMLSSLDF